MAMPWLLIGLPTVIATIPATKKIRCMRAIWTLLAVIALGAVDAVAKIYLSAQIARGKHSSTIEPRPQGISSRSAEGYREFRLETITWVISAGTFVPRSDLESNSLANVYKQMAATLPSVAREHNQMADTM